MNYKHFAENHLQAVLEINGNKTGFSNQVDLLNATNIATWLCEVIILSCYATLQSATLRDPDCYDTQLTATLRYIPLLHYTI